MSLYALVRNAAYRGSLSTADVELDGVLDGNLCRCTGYKPILDAAKTFVGEYAGKLAGGGTFLFQPFSCHIDHEA
jgi:xanthine dehydrogenase/oxidase